MKAFERRRAKDNGTGFDPRYADKLFKVFQSGSGSGGGNASAPGQGGRSALLVTVPGSSGSAPAPRSTPGRAGESLDRGWAVEIDLSPGN